MTEPAPACPRCGATVPVSHPRLEHLRLSGLAALRRGIRRQSLRPPDQLMDEQRETVGLASGGQPYQATGSRSDPVENRAPTLAEAGIDKHLADRARKLAALSETEFEEKLAGWRARVQEENDRITLNLLESGDRHIRGTFGTGETEWYTPPEQLEAARRVLGTFDLDPASSDVAQQAVRAIKRKRPTKCSSCETKRSTA